MPHAPVLVPVLAERHHGDATAKATTEAMRQGARRLMASRPEVLVVISPHTPRSRRGVCFWAGPSMIGSLAQFGVPGRLFELPVAESFGQSWTLALNERGLAPLPLSDEPLDHGAVVPLFFLAEAGWNGPTMVMGLPEPADEHTVSLGEAIAHAAAETGQRAAVLASGDMSHALKPGAPAGYHPLAAGFDQKFMDLVRTGAYRELTGIDNDLRDLAAEDVLDSTVAATAAAKWNSQGHAVLSYEGPFGVGYGVAVLWDTPGPEAETSTQDYTGGEALPGLARASIAALLAGSPAIPPLAHTAYLRTQLGVFVTLRDREGELRGCVGSIHPAAENLVDETWRMARQAAHSDPRFAPLAPAELTDMRVEVTVVYPPETVDGLESLDPARYGLIVVDDAGRRAVLLPGLDGIETAEDQFKITCRKGGISPHGAVQISRFSVDKFFEEERP
ncbi:MAG TPA: AmmeMemoRadiSam system protein A [Bacillota bacterium]|nr:AmmeMemoRadiSam system protein A [Bacillota bacterium]